MPSKSETLDAVKTAFIGGGVAFAVTVTVIIVSLFAGPAWASSLAGFPFTLVMFAIAATIVNKEKEQTNFNRFLMLSSALYFVMFVVVLIWWLISHYKLQSSSWPKRTWSAFAIAISLWVIAIITLLVNYYTNPKWKNYLNPTHKPENEVATALPPLPPPIPTASKD
jgi:Kef-type K+ transport system membrane component KefB